MKVLIIGGGPAGILAAISSAKNGNEVTIFEKMNSLGKKLLITGKGRCNITNGIPISEFIKNVPGNGKFLFSVFNNFNNEDIVNLLKEEGLQTKEERGNRIFPTTDKAYDVLQALLSRLKKLNVKIETNSKVEEIVLNGKEAKGIKVKQNENEKIIYGDKIVLATGGMSYSVTGSTGDGYMMAKRLGHTITDIKPSLVPITTSKDSLDICRSMQGLSLKNVSIKIKDCKNNKVIYEDFGEMLFTHFGVSGPIILSASAHLIRYSNIDELLKEGQIKLYIDFKPALDYQKLDSRILRDFEKEKNKQFKNSLNDLLPQKMIGTVIELSSINPEKKVNEITKKEREKLLKLLKEFEITLSGFRPIEEAIITSGGINIKEINPKTMESKIIKNLFFAGEIIDVDAYTGGFNLQIAYSTGFTAGGDY